MSIIYTLADFHDVPTLAVINSLSTHDEERFTHADKHLLTTLFLDYCQSENGHQLLRGALSLPKFYIDSEIYHDRLIALLSSPVGYVAERVIFLIARLPLVASRHWQALLAYYFKPTLVDDLEQIVLDPISGAYAILEFVRRGYEYRSMMREHVEVPPPPEVSIDDWRRGVQMIYKAIHGQIPPADFSLLLESTELYWRRIGILGLRILVSSISASVISDEGVAKSIFESPQHEVDSHAPRLAIELVAHSVIDVMSHAQKWKEDWLSDAFDRVAERVPLDWTYKFKRLTEDIPSYLDQLLFRLLEHAESIEPDLGYHQYTLASLVHRWENYRDRRVRKLIKYVASAIDSPHEAVRRMAIDLLPRDFYDDHGLFQKLAKCIAHDPSEEVRLSAFDRVSSQQSMYPPELIQHHPGFIQSILQFLRATDPEQRRMGFRFVENRPAIHQSPVLRPILESGLDDPDPWIQMVSIEVLSSTGVKIPDLQARLQRLRETDCAERVERFLAERTSK